jgi:hypothetical protein
MSRPIHFSPVQLQALRAERYRQKPALRLRDEREAVGFINDVGICLLFSAQGIELPTLWGAICGEERLIPDHHDDYELGLAWSWKDSIPERGEALYGKFLRHKPVFIALDLVPHFYALSPNYGEVDDYLEEYAAGRLSEEAKRIYEVLLHEGPLPTSELRRKAGISGRSVAGLFDRALAELQMSFKIVKAGISDANRWKYCYVYDLFLRRWPAQVAAARSITQDQAATTILTRYLRTVVAARAAEVGRLFGWDAWRLERTVNRLAEAGRLEPAASVEGDSRPYLALT